MKKQTSIWKYFFFFFIFFVTLGIISCSYLSIGHRDDVIELPSLYKGNDGPLTYNCAVIKGKIVSSDDLKNFTILIAYSLSSESDSFTDYVTLNGTSPFMLYLPEGRYHLYTITDFNNDGIYKENEVSGNYGFPLSPKEISLRKGEMVKDIVIYISKENSKKIAFPRQLSIKENYDTVSQLTYTGQVSKIYDEKFSAENASTGWWNPTAFMKAFGAHIYFMEEYDPRKIPVLFVHGAEGSPQNWIYFFIRLDRSRYQPWFFYYPSGIHLSLASQLLYDELIELYDKYGFKKMCIAAHSIGGLVTRSLLTKYKFDKQHNFVKLYVTFATPWTGFEAADASQKLPHKSIPSWMDIGSQSIFIRRTMSAELPSNIRYYLFYGKEDKVSKGKALDERAALDACEKFAFDCDHYSILSDRKVFIKFNKILEKELFFQKNNAR
jgi:pimeloyl-ACP methyl ester carboxylesterase